MKTTISKKLLGMVLESIRAEQNPGQPPFSAYVIVNRLRLDDEGNICLGSSGGLHEILDQIDEIKSELDELANACVLELARSVAANHSKLRIVSTASGGEALTRSDAVTEKAQAALILDLRGRLKGGGSPKNQGEQQS
jgi:hypothetical protein